MSKIVTSIRIEESLKDRLAAYNNIRETFGFDRYSLGEVVEKCVDDFIRQDKEKMSQFAKLMQDSLDEL